jgi:hypothetical protein
MMLSHRGGGGSGLGCDSDETRPDETGFAFPSLRLHLCCLFAGCLLLISSDAMGLMLSSYLGPILNMHVETRLQAANLDPIVATRIVRPHPIAACPSLGPRQHADLFQQ